MQEDGVEMEVGEDKMPPKMRKRWIHRSAEVLKDMLERGVGVGGAEGEGESDRMDVDGDDSTLGELVMLVR